MDLPGKDMYEDVDEIFDEDESVEEEEVETHLRLRPRPPRASLTHHAIKTELMKMNKHQHKQESLEHELSDDKLSRAARKRKRRREKVLEERRASGRSEELDDDLALFKSMSIARRRSSVIPSSASFNHQLNPSSKSSFCSKLRCIFWVAIFFGITFGLVYVFPEIPDMNLDLVDTNVELENGENAVPVDPIEKKIREMQETMNMAEEQLSHNAFEKIQNQQTPDFESDFENQASTDADKISNQNRHINAEENYDVLRDQLRYDENMARSIVENMDESNNEQENSQKIKSDSAYDNQESFVCVIQGVQHYNLNYNQCEQLKNGNYYSQINNEDQNSENIYNQEQTNQELNNDEQFYFF